MLMTFPPGSFSGSCQHAIHALQLGPSCALTPPDRYARWHPSPQQLGGHRLGLPACSFSLFWPNNMAIMANQMLQR